jgi:hypothetical protein
MLVVRADGFVDPYVPSLAHKPPSGRGWVHEVKHVGYRLIVRREAVVAGPYRVAVFDALHRRGRVTDAIRGLAAVPLGTERWCSCPLASWGWRVSCRSG